MRPTDKLSKDSKNTLGYSSRFIEDYLFHKSWKIFNQMNVIGFTVNPEFCSGNYYAYFMYIYKWYYICVFELSCRHVHIYINNNGYDDSVRSVRKAIPVMHRTIWKH